MDSRLRGNDGGGVWVPAFAGMTNSEVSYRELNIYNLSALLLLELAHA